MFLTRCFHIAAFNYINAMQVKLEALLVHFTVLMADRVTRAKIADEDAFARNKQLKEKRDKEEESARAFEMVALERLKVGCG
jgi:hypothetical protein